MMLKEVINQLEQKWGPFADAVLSIHKRPPRLFKLIDNLFEHYAIVPPTAKIISSNCDMTFTTGAQFDGLFQL